LVVEYYPKHGTQLVLDEDVLAVRHVGSLDRLGDRDLPINALDKIEQRLLADSRFKVLYHDGDAVVFTVPRPAGTAAAGVTP
jgi:hypothetical protein